MLQIKGDLQNKTVAVTGCTGGLGKELCAYLCKAGVKLIMLDRNAQKSAALENELKRSFEGTDIERIPIQLEDIGSVKAATDKLINLNPDFFISNAGAYSIPRKICNTGYDNIFQINFVSPYYMIKRLNEALPEIKIIAVGSIAHNYTRFNPDNLDFNGVKSNAKAYGNSKRFLMFSLYKLLGDTGRLSVVHPGITFTNITAHYPKIIFAIIKHPMKIIFMKPKKAALSLLAGVYNSTKPFYWIGPRIFNVWGKPTLKALKAKEKEANDIFNATETIIF